MALPPRLEEHFRAPRRAGRLAGATGSARAENPACGDVVEVFVRVEEGRLADASFLAQGCPATLAGVSFVLERAVGLAVAEARAFEVDALMTEAGETSAVRRHGLALAARALREALA